MEVNRRVDVYGVNGRVTNQAVKIGVPVLQSELVPDRVQPFLVSLADGIQLGVRMMLVDRNEFFPKSKSDDRYINLLVSHGVPL
jgi:hypothetical protein